jgi:hypothetical protein
MEWQVACDRAQVLDDLVLHGFGPKLMASAAEDLGLSKAMLYRLLALCQPKSSEGVEEHNVATGP